MCLHARCLLELRELSSHWFVKLSTCNVPFELGIKFVLRRSPPHGHSAGFSSVSRGGNETEYYGVYLFVARPYLAFKPSDSVVNTRASQEGHRELSFRSIHSTPCEGAIAHW
jgi:hypothetical protein